MSQFIFWGLFLVLGGIVVAYLVWMMWVEAGQKNLTNSDNRQIKE